MAIPTIISGQYGLIQYGFFGYGWPGIASATPAALTLACPTLNQGTVGTAYSAFLTAAGGTPPYTYSIVAGSLPTGLSLNASTGEISGTPTVAGSFAYTAQVTDATPTSATANCSVLIVPSGTPSTCIVPPAPSYSVVLTATREPDELGGT